MDIKIEKNIEVPYKWRGYMNPYVSILQSMENDESFKYPLKDQSLIRSAINIAQKNTNKKYMTRKISEDFRRLWRVK